MARQSPTPYSVHEVFTPTTQARLNFIDRPQDVDSRLVGALRTPGMQVILFGESGSGKSSLLYKRLSQYYTGHVTTRCSASTTFEHILMDGFDQLSPFYKSQTSTSSARSIHPSLGVDFARLRAAVDASLTKTDLDQHNRVLPIQLTVQRLGEFLGAVKCCWVIEDFHKVPSTEKHYLAQALKVFSDLASDFPDVKIVAVGASKSAREVVLFDAEMKHRVSEIRVPLMTRDELIEILSNGQRLLNVDMSDHIGSIASYSVGVASVCHYLALQACLDAGVNVTQIHTVRISDANLRVATENYVQESSDTLAARFDMALERHRAQSYDHCRLILGGLASGPLDGMLPDDILTKIREAEPSYSRVHLVRYSNQLAKDGRGALLIMTPTGRIRFVEPIYHTYAQLVLLAPATLARSPSKLQSLILDYISTTADQSSGAETTDLVFPANEFSSLLEQLGQKREFPHRD